MVMFIDWIKTHKLTALAIAVFAWLLWPQASYRIESILNLSSFNTAGSPQLDYIDDYAGGVAPMMGYGGSKEMVSTSYWPPYDPEVPPTETTNRVVVRDSYMAMLVDDVKETQTKIINQAESVGGYMVNSDLSRPDDAPYATVTARVPVDKLDATLDVIRSFAVKVTAETITGQDVTAEFEDLEEHIAQLMTTKTKFEEIRDKSVEIADLLTVTREITNIQTQIDSYKGRQKYLEQTAKFSKIMVTLSTDELALPYTPNDTFRPMVIFKEATRALYGTLRDVGAFFIWVGVYATIWVPVGLIGLWWYKRRKKI